MATNAEYGYPDLAPWDRGFTIRKWIEAIESYANARSPYHRVKAGEVLDDWTIIVLDSDGATSV